MSPSQNPGPRHRRRRSSSRPGRPRCAGGRGDGPELTPPSTAVRTKAKAARASVAGSRSAIAWATLRPSRMDWPRSPRRSPAYQRPSRTRNGRIEAELLADPLDLVGRRADPCHHDRRVARHHVHDAERDEGDEEQDEDRRAEAAGDVPSHARRPGLPVREDPDGRHHLHGARDGGRRAARSLQPHVPESVRPLVRLEPDEVFTMPSLKPWSPSFRM